MTDADTCDVTATVAQVKLLADAGSAIVALTQPPNKALPMKRMPH